MVRDGIFYALGMVLVAALLASLRHPDDVMRRAAAGALGALARAGVRVFEARFWWRASASGV